MNHLLHPGVRIVAAIVGLGLGSCAPQSSQDESTQANTSRRVAASGAKTAIETDPLAEARANSSTPNAGKERSRIDMPSKTPEGTPGKVYVAVLKKAVAVPLLAPTGTISVKDSCLVATIDGVDHTAVLPPQARLVGPPDVPTAIKLSRRSVPLGRQISLPAGGAEFSPADLRSLIPANCPPRSIVFAG